MKFFYIMQTIVNLIPEGLNFLERVINVFDFLQSDFNLTDTIGSLGEELASTIGELDGSTILTAAAANLIGNSDSILEPLKNLKTLPTTVIDERI